MYVDSEARSKGISRALLSRLLQDLARDGIKKARLDVVADQVVARRLYLSLGFVVTGSSVQTLGDGLEHVELQMELLLTPNAIV
jgi:ribosomal protein S18 acetylase RimI-like enzyme